MATGPKSPPAAADECPDGLQIQKAVVAEDVELVELRHHVQHDLGPIRIGADIDRLRLSQRHDQRRGQLLNVR
jgi:hypothetical protein